MKMDLIYNNKCIPIVGPFQQNIKKKRNTFF